MLSIRYGILIFSPMASVVRTAISVGTAAALVTACSQASSRSPERVTAAPTFTSAPPPDLATQRPAILQAIPTPHSVIQQDYPTVDPLERTDWNRHTEPIPAYSSVTRYGFTVMNRTPNNQFLYTLSLKRLITVFNCPHSIVLTTGDSDPPTGPDSLQASVDGPTDVNIGILGQCASLPGASHEEVQRTGLEALLIVVGITYEVAHTAYPEAVTDEAKYSNLQRLAAEGDVGPLIHTEFIDDLARLSDDLAGKTPQP